jgi:glycosyltransferase involved in cell wall biosynthesis
LRVAFLTPTLLMGGAERWMISLARRCDRERIEWVGTALSAGAPATAELCREMSAFMPVFAGPNAGPPDGASVVRCRSARAALEAATQDADVLIMWGLADLATLIAGLRIPVVIFASHGPGEWTERSARRSESGATHFVAVSEPALLPFSPCIRQRATVIHNGIEVERCTPRLSRSQVRAAWGFQEQHRLIGYVGRYSGEKNPAAAAHAAARLGGDYRAVYVGEGWMEPALRRQVAEIAGDRAKFVPMTRQVGNALVALDALVLASPAEGFSLSLAEAWYHQVPVVATRVGAVPELERRHGTLVSLVAVWPCPLKLTRAVEQALTPEFREEVLPRAHAAVCRYYTASVMAERWTRFLEAARREVS